MECRAIQRCDSVGIPCPQCAAWPTLHSHDADLAIFEPEDDIGTRISSTSAKYKRFIAERWKMVDKFGQNSHIRWEASGFAAKNEGLDESSSIRGFQEIEMRLSSQWS